jgi:hypothetical protein
MKTGDDGTYPEYFLRELRKTSVTSRLSPVFLSPVFMPPPPTLRFPGRTGVASRSHLAHDNHQNFNFLFRLR